MPTTTVSPAKKGRENLFYVYCSLGFSLDEAKEFEADLIRRSQVKGYFIYKGHNGKTFCQEAILDPDVEEYFRFDSGLIFKIVNDMSFYYLDGDGRWIHDGDLQRMFIDPQYSFIRIGYSLSPPDSNG